MIHRMYKHEIESLYHTPLTAKLIAILKEIANTEAAERLETFNINRDSSLVHAEIAELRGRQRMISVLSDPALLIQFLDEYVIEEKIDNG